MDNVSRDLLWGFVGNALHFLKPRIHVRLKTNKLSDKGIPIESVKATAVLSKGTASEHVRLCH